MNYYKRHLGDYAAATRHLTMMEHGAYTLLLDLYYVGEKPLPSEDRAVYRLVGARSKEEREAVSQVLKEFFDLRDDGWHQGRCDAELAIAAEKAAKNRQTGKLGGRPKKTQTVSESETQTVIPENPNGFYEETQTVSENNPSHKPITNNHKKQEVASPQFPPDTHEPPTCDPTSPGFETVPTTPTRKGALSKRLRVLGIDAAPHYEAWPGLLARFTDEEILAAAEKARDAKPGQRVSLGYLVPMLNDPKPVKAAQSAPNANAWAFSNAGIDQKGRELGMFARGGESYPDFKNRIYEELRRRQGTQETAA